MGEILPDRAGRRQVDWPSSTAADPGADDGRGAGAQRVRGRSPARPGAAAGRAGRRPRRLQRRAGLGAAEGGGVGRRRRAGRHAGAPARGRPRRQAGQHLPRQPRPGPAVPPGPDRAVRPRRRHPGRSWTAPASPPPAPAARPRWRPAPWPGPTRRCWPSSARACRAAPTWTRSRWCASSGRSGWPPGPRARGGAGRRPPGGPRGRLLRGGGRRGRRGLLLHRRPPAHPGGRLAGPRRPRQLGRGTFGPELDPATVRAGRVFVEWRGAAANPPPAGAHDLQGLDPDTLTEVGEVLAGTRPGRTTPGELTVYKSTGHAVEDAAAADLVYRRALESGAGVTVSI